MRKPTFLKSYGAQESVKKDPFASPAPKISPSAPIKIAPKKDTTVKPSSIGDSTLMPGQQNIALEGLKTYTDTNIKRNPITNQIGHAPNKL